MERTPTIDSGAEHESRLLALSPDLLGAVGFDGALKLLNPAWSRALGRGEEELVGIPFLELVQEDDRPATARVIERLRHGGTVADFTCRLVRADGGYVFVLWSGHGSPEYA